LNKIEYKNESSNMDEYALLGCLKLSFQQLSSDNEETSEFSTVTINHSSKFKTSET